MRERTINSRRIYRGRMIGMRDDRVRLSNGRISHREVCEHPGAVAVIALTKKKEIVLIRQFRKPAERVLIEVPAGLFNKREPLKKAALRELKEETGFAAKKIRHAFSLYTSPGYSTEVLHFFFASGLEPGDQGTEEDEHIEVYVVPLKRAVKLVKEGKIMDAKTVIGILAASSFK